MTEASDGVEPLDALVMRKQEGSAFRMAEANGAVCHSARSTRKRKVCVSRMEGGSSAVWTAAANMPRQVANASLTEEDANVTFVIVMPSEMRAVFRTAVEDGARSTTATERLARRDCAGITAVSQSAESRLVAKAAIPRTDCVGHTSDRRRIKRRRIQISTV